MEGMGGLVHGIGNCWRIAIHILCRNGGVNMKWTRKAPNTPGWYWWRNLQKKHVAEQGPFIYMVRWYGKNLAIGNCNIEDSHYTRGEWQGPITPSEEQE